MGPIDKYKKFSKNLISTSQYLFRQISMETLNSHFVSYIYICLSGACCELNRVIFTYLRKLLVSYVSIT